MVGLYQECIDAFSEPKEKDKYQIIISVGNQVDCKRFGKLPDYIEIYPYVDQIAVLEKADVFVSHCGMNSVSESLYFGVPLVMLPQTSEQKGVAARVSQLGAGLQIGKMNAKEIRNAVELVMNQNVYRENVKKISDGFKKCTGAKVQRIKSSR